MPSMCRMPACAARHDSTVENGCMWAKPGGHRTTLRSWFRRKAEGGTDFQVFDDSPLTVDDMIPLEAKKGTCIVLDGLLGLGSKHLLREPIRTAAREINRLRREQNAFVFAVDLPTGFDIAATEAPARARFEDQYPKFRAQFVQEHQIEAAEGAMCT